MKKTSIAIAAISVFAHANVSAAQHSHGAAALNLAFADDAALIEVEVPADDVVGFEYAPQSDAEIQAVAQAIEALNSASLFSFNQSAACVHAESEVEFETEGSHAEFHLLHSFTCEAPNNIDRLSTQIFDLLPSLVELEVEAVSATGAFAVEWERDSASIDIE